MSITKNDLLSTYESMLAQGVDRGTIIALMTDHKKHLGPYIIAGVRNNGFGEKISEFRQAVQWIDERIAELSTEVEADAASAKRLAFQESLKNHQVKCQGIVNFGLLVTLTASKNEYITYPARGLLVIQEHGTDLGINKAVFHHLNDDGSLGPPVVVSRPQFTYDAD